MNEKFKKITKNTTTGIDGHYWGKLTQCPYCQYQVMMYHFQWNEIMCQNCKKKVNKYEWLVDVTS